MMRPGATSTRRPPRRTLRRQARAMPVMRHLERLERAVHALTPLHALDAAGLGALFSAVHAAGHGHTAWAVRDLALAGLLPAGCHTGRLGQALGELARAGGHLGPWHLQAVGQCRHGRLWTVARRW